MAAAKDWAERCIGCDRAEPPFGLIRFFLRNPVGAWTHRSRCLERRQCWAHREEQAARRNRRNKRPADLPLKPLCEKGRSWCRWCGERVYRKAKDGRIVPDNRRCWHDGRVVDVRAVAEDRCVQEYNAQAFTFRGAIWQRDRGVCASCGRDVAAERDLWDTQMKAIRGEWQAVRDLKYEEAGASGWWAAVQPVLVGEQAALNAFMRDNPRPEWQADHIVPLEDDPKGHLIANGQTLCVPCHIAKTARENSERATRRKQEAHVR